MVIFCFVIVIICIGEGVIIWRLSKEPKSTIKSTVEFFRNFWGKFVVYVLATSIIGLFLGSIYYKQIVGLDEINSWVSIVLGLVALVIGIISLFLSFYNLDQAIEAQRESTQIMEKVKEDIQANIARLTDEMQEEFKDLHKEVSDYKGKTHESVMADDLGKKDWGEF